MPDQPDLDEPFSLYPTRSLHRGRPAEPEGEDVLRRLMGEDGEVDDASDDDLEDEDS